MYLYDTNALITLIDNNNINNVIDNVFYVTQITLQELENLKANINKTTELQIKVKKAINWLNDNPDKWKFVPYDESACGIINSLRLLATNDNKICAIAKKISRTIDNIIFVTGDISCKLIAQDIFQLNVETCFDTPDPIYKGYKKIVGTSEEINNAMNKIYDNNYNSWNINEYLIIQNTDDGSESEMRFNGKEFVSLKLPSSRYIKAKNALQRCALDILLNQDITIAAIIGGHGSGKSFLTTRMALYSVKEKGYQSKIVVIREPLGEGKELGYLPGSFLEKNEPFTKAIEQQLEGGEFEMDTLIQRGVIETNIPYYLKGLTLNSSIICCDEAEDLNEKQIKLVGTRIGENSRIFFNGDYKQSVINASEKNALIKMCNALKGDPMFSCIYLDEDVRSTTSKKFANLW